jgi:hypothetical protein
MPEQYPDGNPKTVIGMSKPSVRAIPPIAELHLGAAMSDGEKKYGRFNWREKQVTASVYYDAIRRHLAGWWDGEDYAQDSGVHHLGHVMACCAILLDAAASGKLNDDRIPGPSVSFLHNPYGDPLPLRAATTPTGRIVSDTRPDLHQVPLPWKTTPATAELKPGAITYTNDISREELLGLMVADAGGGA